MFHRTLLMLSAILFLTCQPLSHQSEDQPSTDTISVRETGPTSPSKDDEGTRMPPPDFDTLVYSMGDESITYEDLVHQQRLDQLLGRPPSSLADAYHRFRLAERILQGRILFAEGVRLELMPSSEELDTLWSQHPELVSLQDLSPEQRASRLEEIGLTTEDLTHQLTLEWMTERWLDLVLERVSEDQLLTEYLRQNENLFVDHIETPNVPSNAEISQFIRQETDWIEAHYEANTSRYTLPPMADVRIVRLRVDRDASEVERLARNNRIENLWERARDGEDFVSLATHHSDDPASDQGGLLQGVIPRQIPAAFEINVDEISDIQQDRWGAYFIRLESRQPARPRPLDDLLRREIASEYLGYSLPLPGPERIAERALELLRTGREQELQRLVAEHGLIRRRLGPIRQDDEMIPGIGHDRPFLERLFELTEEQPVPEEAPFIDGGLHAVRLLERNRPSEADFQRDRPTFERNYRRFLRETAMDAYFARRLEQTPMVSHWR